MYLAVILLTMLVLPIGSMIAEHAAGPAPWTLLLGKWFVFWAVGVRLSLAGVRQFFQPAFTAEQIFHIDRPEVLPLVRELGVANIATGVVGLASLAAPAFVLPVAISAGIFYCVAGIRHAMERGRSGNETIAMISDLFVFFVLAAFAGSVLAG
ncbi:MAG: hypothetical protein JWN66_2893 [Sphingomonas bacterium]|uniref:DUF6790 family protein n=1 Tax=Sphingomonas bacterium TaxID=1895847 RepID=UPI00262104FA|nr:DUF6790 family protein [Sphingomonas bacterium]MDB5705777.1 hypothetical protein [Sphingomonas bacterium]